MRLDLTLHCIQEDFIHGADYAPRAVKSHVTSTVLFQAAGILMQVTIEMHTAPMTLIPFLDGIMEKTEDDKLIESGLDCRNTR